MSQYPRAFVLQRNEDETGVSGTGVVAEGVEFSDGTVALRWTSAWPTSVVFHERGIQSVEAVHGHGGKTQIEWTSGDLPERNERALNIALEYGQNDGGHHKMWVIDQMLRALTGPSYDRFIDDYCEDGEYSWDEGTPP